MHKFFCNYNAITQKYELAINRNNIFGRTYAMADNTLLSSIRDDLQKLYELIVKIKENEKEDKKLEILDETELLISNLFYSFFERPLELFEDKSELNGKELNEALQLVTNLERDINIPEYNRVCTLIKNNINLLLANFNN